MTEIPQLEIRNKIYKLLSVNPGLNLSTIAEVLNISVPLADYHLNYMVDNEIISVAKEGGYKRYYIKGIVGTEEKKILSLLHQDIPLNIATFLLERLRAKPKEMREHLNISPALLTYYLKKMVRYGVISPNAEGEKKEFILVDEQQIANIIIRYKPNILLKRFRDAWVVDFPLSSKIPKKKK